MVLAYLHSTLPPCFPHGCDVSFPEAKAQVQMGINVQARATDIIAPEVMSFSNCIFWSLEPTVTNVMFLATWQGMTWVPPEWVTLDPREVSHHLLPCVVLQLPCTASEPTGHVWWVSRSVVTSTPRGGPLGKKQRSSSKGCKKGWKKQGMNFTLALWDLTGLCPWTRPEPWINCHSSPNTYFGIYQGPNCIATWWMYTYPDSIDKIIRR